MSVTVVIISRNRREDLLVSLPRHEAPVILVDNGSTDGTVEAVRAAGLRHVRVVALPHNLGAVARNLGVQQARTPYVAFADDDSWWAPGALDQAAAVLDAHPRVGLLTGRILLGTAELPDPLSDGMDLAPLGTSPGGAGPDVLGFAACAAVVRRSAFLAAGGFDEVVRFPGEEERLALDLADTGWLLSYVPGLVVHHHPSPVRGPASVRATGITRSTLLTAVLRRPWPVVRDRAVRDLRAGGTARAGVLAALPRLPGALWARRRISDRVETRLHTLAAAETAVRAPALVLPSRPPLAPVPLDIGARG